MVAVNDAARAHLGLSSVSQRVVGRRAFKLCACVDMLATVEGMLNQGRTRPAGYAFTWLQGWRETGEMEFSLRTRSKDT
jgi:hypothetical protein